MNTGSNNHYRKHRRTQYIAGLAEHQRKQAESKAYGKDDVYNRF